MALTERSRAALYQGLHQIIDDEEVVGDVVSHISLNDPDELVTKEFLRAELRASAEPLASEELVRAETLATREFVRSETLATRELLRVEIEGTKEFVRSETLATREFVRSETLATRELLRVEIEGTKEFVRAEVGAASNRLIVWMVGYGTTLVALVLLASRIG